MWRSISLSARLNLIFASLFALWLVVDAAHVVLQASGRTRAETQSAMRLTREFVSTALARLSAPPERGAVEALVASLQNLRHVRAGLGEPALASSIIREANTESDAPQWFRALVNAPSEVATIPIRLSDARTESIVIVADPADEIDEVWAGARDHALVGAMLALAALAVTSLLVGRALKPLGVASAALARLEAGDYAARAEGGGPPEIRKLNATIDSLAEALGALKRANSELAERVFDAQDEERQAIAHDLHDEFGPHLFALRASAAALAKKLGGDPSARAAASAIEAQVEALQRQNRRILADLRPAALEELGLAEALEALVAHWGRAEPGVAVALHVDPPVDAMSERASLMAYRFVQEAMTNAFRHAGATRIEVSLRFETPAPESGPRDAGLGGLVIRVADDGRGLHGDTEAGMGLAGMRDRVRAARRPGHDRLSARGRRRGRGALRRRRRGRAGKSPGECRNGSRKIFQSLKLLAAARGAKLRRSHGSRAQETPGVSCLAASRTTTDGAAAQERRMTPRTASWRGLIGLAFVAPALPARADTIVLPTFNVVATTPLNGGQINVAQSPFAVWQTGAQDIQTFNDTTLTGALGRSAPGVTVGNVSGNDFQPDLSYRGFDATAVTGTPQGLAVYQNGTRINESFGDVVNWDLIPTNAIDKTTIIAANPIFGLNALGGAVTVTMKNGFTWQGFEADLEGGSFYRAQEQIQYGKQVGSYSVYLAASQINDGGWRAASASQLTNFYGDVGFKANGFESHLQLTAGNTQFGAAAYTPIQLLQSNWGSVYTIPQTTYNQMVMLQWNGAYAYSPTLSFQAAAYFRQFNQQHVDSNATDVTPCPPYSCLNGSPVHDTLGGIIPDISQGGTLDLGEDDDNQTQSRTVGVSGQVVDTDKIWGRDNSLTVGTSLDYGWTHYIGSSQLGTIAFAGDAYPLTASPYIIDEPASFLNPIDVRANNTYAGAYALDTFNATDRLTLTGGARFNFAGINLEGTNDALLSGYSDYFHLNPTAGLTYKITPDVNFYAGYAMTNRTPTPLELGCASPTYPCIIDNFLSSDPPLKQVVGNTFELGFRGQNALAFLGPQWGKLQWSAGLFRTTLASDILPVVSTFNGFGYYTNVGTTLRQGAEVSAQWTGDKWTAYANYTYIDAIYLTTFEEPSPNNPLAAANGDIPITNGTPIAGIPKNTVKVGVDYAVTPNWKVGADMLAASGQVLFGNENGAVPQAPGYAVFGLHTSYQWNKQVQLYGYVQNLFDQRYYTSGGLVRTGEFMTGPSITNPQTFGPGKPFAIYGGLRITL